MGDFIADLVAEAGFEAAARVRAHIVPHSPGEDDARDMASMLETMASMICYRDEMFGHVKRNSRR